MSASNPAINKIQKILSELSYEPVLDSDSLIKNWASSHNNGLLGAFINGNYVVPNETSFFEVKNPFNGNMLAKIANTDQATFNQALDSSVNSLKEWQELGFTGRGRIIYNIARNIQKHLQILTLCESVCSGRTGREVKDLDIASIIKTLYYYSGSISFDNLNEYESMGVVSIVSYYDSSLLCLIRKLAPALACGNVVCIVPHKLNPLSTYMLIDICVQSGVPVGVINLVANANDDIYKWIASDSRINEICFDGRFITYHELILSNSFIDPNKRILLNLEGKSSMVIYDSADIDSAIETVVDGCFYSNGQHRYSLNKVFVQENIFEDVNQRLERRFNKLRVGNHLDKCNDFSMLLNSNDLQTFKETFKTHVDEYGVKSKEFNSSLQTKSDALLAPTILRNVSIGSQLNLNELNGPYVILVPFRTVKESVDLINCSRLGFGVSLYSQNISLVFEVAYLLNVGTVWINGFPIERGVQVRKQSGNYQINGFKSLRNFLRPKWESSVAMSESKVELVQAQQLLKTFGATSSTLTLPTNENLDLEKTYKLYVGGKQTRSDTQASRSVFLPNSNKLHCLIADASRKDVRNAVELAVSAFNSWWKRPNHNKSQILYYFGENLMTRSAEFLNKLEIFTSKSKSECEREMRLCFDLIFYFASVCDKYIGNLNDTTEYGYLLESEEPLGVIAIVCGSNPSQNYPLLKFILHLVSAITYGNTVIMVPDSKSPFPALDLYEIFDTSDMPGGVVNILTGDKHHLTKYLCEHQQLNAVWYMNDMEMNGKMNDIEINAQRFITHTSAFSLKQNWFINNIPFDSDGFVSRSYLNELRLHSVQSKYINIPMGTIFAN